MLFFLCRFQWIVYTAKFERNRLKKRRMYKLYGHNQPNPKATIIIAAVAFFLLFPSRNNHILDYYLNYRT